MTAEVHDSREKGGGTLRAVRKARRAERREKSRRRTVFWLRVVCGGFRWTPLPIACAIGDVLGSTAWFVARRYRRQTLSHLEFALPERSLRERRRIGRRSFALLARGAAAFVVSHRMGPERALSRIAMDDLTPFNEARAAGRGVLLVTFHFGCFEMLASWLGSRLGPAKAVGRPAEQGGPTEMLVAMRRDLGCDTIERGDPREILRLLRSGGAVAMLVDQDTSDVNGVFVPFFGRLAHTPVGPAALAVRTGAPVVMGFIEWVGLTRHKATVLPAMRPLEGLDADDAVLELTARMTAAGEAFVRRRPDHWVWVHRRWETRPEDRPRAAVYAGGTR